MKKPTATDFSPCKMPHLAVSLLVFKGSRLRKSQFTKLTNFLHLMLYVHALA